MTPVIPIQIQDYFELMQDSMKSVGYHGTFRYRLEKLDPTNMTEIRRRLDDEEIGSNSPIIQVKSSLRWDNDAREIRYERHITFYDDSEVCLDSKTIQDWPEDVCYSALSLIHWIEVIFKEWYESQNRRMDHHAHS